MTALSNPYVKSFLNPPPPRNRLPHYCQTKYYTWRWERDEGMLWEGYNHSWSDTRPPEDSPPDGTSGWAIDHIRGRMPWGLEREDLCVYCSDTTAERWTDRGSGMKSCSEGEDELCYHWLWQVLLVDRVEVALITPPRPKGRRRSYGGNLLWNIISLGANFAHITYLPMNSKFS